MQLKAAHQHVEKLLNGELIEPVFSINLKDYEEHPLRYISSLERSKPAHTTRITAVSCSGGKIMASILY